MSAEDLMSTKIVTVEMDDTVEEIKNIFENSRFHHLLVVEADTLVGVISDRDLLKSLSPFIGTFSQTKRDKSTLTVKAHQIMTRELVTVQPHASIYTVIDIFNTRNISCIPVVTRDYNPLGIISWRDILRFLRKSD